MKKNRVEKECVVCESIFSVIKYRESVAKCCSRKCSDLNKVGHKPTNYKGGMLKNNGYIYILSKDHPNGDRDGYVLQHRLVVEKSLGRYLDKKEVVHHRNGNRSDNRIENLELISSQSEHMKEHYPKGMSFSQRSLLLA